MFRGITFIVTAAAALFAAPLGAQKISLTLNGAIADGAELLSDEFEDATNLRLLKIEEHSGISILILTVLSLEGADASVVASKVGELLQGADKVGPNWTVILIAPKERQVATAIFVPVEPSEGIDPAELLSQQEQRDIAQHFADTVGAAMTPFLENDRWEEAVRVGVDALEAQMDSSSKDDDGVAATESMRVS